MQTITFIIILLISNLMTYMTTYFILSQNKKELKSKAIQLKIILEDSIKDRKIDKEEYIKLRDAVLNLEEHILEWAFSE